MTSERPIRRKWPLARGLLCLTAAGLIASALTGSQGARNAAAAVPAVPSRVSLAAATAEPTWTTLTPKSGPPPLANASAVYDSDNNTVVLFGGRLSDGTLSTDTWVWTGSTWKDYPAATVHAPPARQMASMAFDPALHQLILFGGQGTLGQVLGDTWAWNGASWFEEPNPSSQPAPAAREDAPLAYDAAGHLVLFGGTTFAPPLSAGPQAGTSGPTSSPDAGPTGPTGGSTPTSLSAASSTTTTAPSSAPPAGPATALSDTWEWTSGGWVASNGAGPSARTGASLAYDSTSGLTVLFAGQSTPTGSKAPKLLADTWTWNGSTWTHEQPRRSPPARYDASVADQPTLQGSVVVAGVGKSGALGDTWLWSGRTWTQLRTTGQPTARSGAAAAYSSAGQEMLVYGGTDSRGGILRDTWVMTVVFEPSSSVPVVPTTTRANPGSRSTVPTARVRPPPASPTTVLLPPTPVSLAPVAIAIPPTSAPLVTTARDVHRGSPVTLSGTGFKPGTTVTVEFHSNPQLLGKYSANPNGGFSATVIVPDNAAMGDHHFEATGLTPSGGQAQLIAAVVVLPLTGHGVSRAVTASMVAAAVLIPALAWLIMSGAGWWRRRRRGPQPV